MIPDKLLTTIGKCMKEHLFNLIRFTLFFTLTALLQACGGSSDDKTSKYSISANTSSISFANEFLQVSDDTFKVDITFEGNGLLVGYAPDSQPVGWLNYRTENVTATSATLYVDVISAENIIYDLYSTKIRLSTGDVDKVNLVHHDIDVSLLIWQLITDKELISFRGTFGDTEISPQTLAISSEANEWTAESDVDWLTLDVTSGTGDGVITITPNITNFDSAQLYQANIKITELTTGDSKQIPVEIGLDRHYLFSHQSTVSFSKLANINATSKTLIINSNSPETVNWQASSNVDWLTLTRKNNSNELNVAINTESNFSESQNNAVITINAIDSEGMVDESVIAESISLSYYQSNETSENITLSELTANNNALISSPLLPHIYIGINNQLNVYHQYSGELLTTLDVSPADTLLEQLIIHPSGNFLLAKADETITNEDDTTQLVTHRYRIDLTDNSITEIEDATIENEPIQFISFSGRHFIITQTLEFADDNLQRIFWDRENAYFTSQIDQALMSEALYTLDLSDSSFKRYQAIVNDFTSQSIVVEQTHQYRPDLLEESQAVRSFIVDDNETGIYAISPTSEWISFDGETFTDNGLLTQTEGSVTLALTKSHNNRAHYARFVQNSGFIIDIYNEEQSLINTVETQGEQPSTIEISQDDKRLVLNTSSSDQIEIINLEQIQLSISNLTFGTTFGDSNIVEQEVLVSGVSELWQAQSSDDWLVITTSNVDGQALISVAIDETQISGWGLFSATITVVDPESNSSRVVTVTLAVDEVRLYSNYPALSFSAHADKVTLTHTVDILTNKESNVAWQAQADVDWFTLTEDTSNNTLTITLDPLALNTAGLYTATITLSSQTLGDSVDGQINISVSKGDFDTSDFDEIIIENITPNSDGVVLDSLRPYLYVAQRDKIEVYNIIDGSKVTSIQSPLENVDLINLVTHPDGSLLLASNNETYLDENEQEQTRINHYSVALSDFSIAQISEELVDVQYDPQKIIMVSGRPVVVTQALELANLSLTTQYWDNENAFLTSTMTDVINNNTFITYDGVNFNLRHNTLEFNAFADNSVEIVSTTDYINPVFENGLSAVITNTDGSNVFTTNASSEWTTFDGDVFLDQGKLDGNPLSASVALSTDSGNNTYFYRFDFNIGFFTLSKYDDNLSTIWATAYSAGSVDVYISADYQRLIHYNSTDSSLIIDFILD